MAAVEQIVGVIGGMGPLASAEFVRTIYERHRAGREQDAPRVLLWSDPALPDRTDALLHGGADTLARHLERAIDRCCAFGATHVVICCVTAHAALASMAPRATSRVMSLVDALLSVAAQRRRPHLLLASLGSRQMRLFERHALWTAAGPWLRWPDEDEQARVHDAIYAIKRHEGLDAAAALVDALLRKYGVDAWAAGCTELHLVARHRPPRAARLCTDPLEIAADRIAASLDPLPLPATR